MKGRTRAIEALAALPRGRAHELGDALTDTHVGQHIVVHELTCKWRANACTCARITLVCGATA